MCVLFLAHDFTFSDQVSGEHVPFGEAGDCYSAANCPQVFFYHTKYIRIKIPQFFLTSEMLDLYLDTKYLCCFLIILFYYL